MARYKLQEWLTFIGVEVHKNFSPLFSPATPDDVKTAQRDRLANRLKFVDGELAGKQYLMGDTFSVADPYLFTVTNWAALTGVDLSSYSNLLAFRARVAARPAVVAAMTAEGLIK
jgi:glutathione S-transferase